MKITFIHPPALVSIGNYSAFAQPPIGISYLAAYMRAKGHSVSVVDAVGAAIARYRPWHSSRSQFIQGLSFREIAQMIPRDTEVLAVSCMFTHAWPMVREMIIFLKKELPNARMIAGGEHITGMYESVLSHSPVDICILGEGEVTLGELFSVFERREKDLSYIHGIAYIGDGGQVVKTASRERVRNLRELPKPAWDLVDPKVYMKFGYFSGPRVGRPMPMLVSRGCPYECTFCTAPSMWGRVWVPRDPADVIDEIEGYARRYGATDFQFVDTNAFVGKDSVIAFCDEIEKRKLKIQWQIPVGIRPETIDDNIARRLARAGCRYVLLAPETGSYRMQRIIKKRVNLSALDIAAKALVRAGVRFGVVFIIGFPQETREDMCATFRCIRRMARLGADEVGVSVCAVLPGTELFRQIGQVQPILEDDEFCHRATGATSLFQVRSWNSNISNRALCRLRLWALIQFFTLLFYYHPQKIIRFIWNIICSREEIKVHRIVREAANKIRVYGGRFFIKA